MGIIKALLVGVCEYQTCAPLPLCKNDLYALKEALITGLNVDERNINLCGETGRVNIDELIYSINSTSLNITCEDTFIFYFSGHGGKNCLCLSDGIIELQGLIDEIDKINTKNKIVILDSCHSGSFSINGAPKMEIEETVEKFSGHGYAVLASCGAEEYSGFHPDRQISLYTSFVCDALMSKFLIREGKKSLEVINKAICRYAEVWNEKDRGNIQQPIFRATIGGTIFFNVEDYKPYEVAKIYEETDEYIIYEAEPSHNAQAKRLSLKVMLSFQSTLEQIANIFLEIQKKAIYYEVFQNEISEKHHKNKTANMVYCYFGYDEDDMINSNYVCCAIWVDESQDKEWWYRPKKNSVIINGVYIDLFESYKTRKCWNNSSMNNDELIRLTKEYNSRITSAAERYIKIFREYLNHTIIEEQLIEDVSPLNIEINELYLKQTDLPKAPNELHEWSQVYAQIAGTIHNFSLFYDKKNLIIWTEKNRKHLMLGAIEKYANELEEIKTVENKLNL